MPKPFKVSPLVSTVPTYMAPGSDETPQAPATSLIPATVTASWDYYRRTLGETVPTHINMARATAKGFLDLVK